MKRLKLGNILIPIVIVVVVILLFFGSSFITIIDAGYTGVKVTFGSVHNEVFMPGLHIKNPFTNVIAMSTRTEEYTMSSTQYEGARVGDDSIKALTSDGSSVWLDVTVLYHLKADKAPDVYKELGLRYAEKIIRPQIRSSIREATSQFRVIDVYSEKRIELQQTLLADIKSNLDPRGIEVEDVLLRDVVLTQSLADSIAEKLAAQQEAEKLDFEIEKAQKEAERKVIEAKGQRDAQQIINSSLSKNYLHYLYIQNLQNLEGTIYIPTDPNTGLPLFKGL